MIKVLVVDDHDLVRTGITRMLGDQEGIRVVGQADCGEEAVRLARELSPDAPLDMLSERELQIMILIVNCHKVQDVADQLCLSPKTVNTYRYRIFDKLGISSDVEMALVAVRHGMVDADEANPA